MSFCLLNASSLARTNAVQPLSLDIKEHLATETWFTSRHHTNCLSIPNYRLYRRDRANRKSGGGVCVYVRYDIKCVLLNHDTHIDSIQIRVD